MNAETGSQALLDYINNIEGDVGWWYVVPNPSTKYHGEIHYLFPSINELFGIHSNAMNIFLLEIGWYFQCGKSVRIRKEMIEKVRDKVFDRASFEVSTVSLGANRNLLFVKLGYTKERPKDTCKSHSINPRSKHPPRMLASREVTKSALSIMLQTVRNSANYCDMLNVHINSIKFKTLQDESTSASAKNVSEITKERDVVESSSS